MQESPASDCSLLMLILASLRGSMNARPSDIEPCEEKAAPHQAKPLAASAMNVEQCRGPARLLLGVFEVLDRADIAYCVLHGYEGYPWRIRSDVDCIISSDMRPGRLMGLFHENSARIGGEVVHSKGYHLVLAGKNAGGSPCFLTLDLSVDCELDDRPFYAGSEVIGARRRHHQFWIPAPDVEFGCYLVRKIAKGYLDKEQGQRLSYLYRQHAASCRRQVARFWGVSSTALIVSAASSGNWEPVRRRLDELRAELRRRAMLRSPWRVVGNQLRRLADRIMRVCSPDGGLNVVFLGPDGAGKSSVIHAMSQVLAGAFNHTTCYGFAPALFPRLFHRHRPHTPPGQPHGLPPRSSLISVLRAVSYWFGYYTFGYYVTVHLALARSTLVLHDRHLVDALVDPRRYRYGGPLWLLRLIWRLVPKPDLVILLDAPTEVLQARKQEVPFEETARQRDAYLTVIKTMKNGHIVDAARPFEEVIGNVSNIILRHLSRRIARRFELEPTTPRPNLLARIYFRMARDIKRALGVESHLKNEDRRVLEQIIFPYFLREDSYDDILFVGCHWYTKGYNGCFEKKKNYWTIEIEPSRKKYGAKQHIVDGLQNLNKHFKPGTLDLILCDGVFGWGLDAKTDVERAFRACCDCLREGGVLVVGWDDIEERRPFLLQECQGLRALKPFFFPPLGAIEYLTDTPYRHTFTFYVKQ
jgi:thymidylate kinase